MRTFIVSTYVQRNKDFTKNVLGLSHAERVLEHRVVPSDNTRNNLAISALEELLKDYPEREGWESHTAKADPISIGLA